MMGFTDADYNLTSVWGTAGDLWAVGWGGALLHWDGSRWRPIQAGAAGDLYAVTGAADGAVWTVGAGGAVLRRDGARSMENR
jgi:hypothetical protein